mgnify:CR=1 FL=1
MQTQSTPQIQPSHVAILVPSARKAAERLRSEGFQVGPEETWDGEGTREIYIEKDRCNSLLLMEAIKPGAYQRALEKRGPGLHHLAIDVLDIESFLDSLTDSGWLLHPKSLHTLKKVQVAYLARPGFPGLIEVQQKNELMTGVSFVERIELPAHASTGSPTPFDKMLRAIGLEKTVFPNRASASLTLSGVQIALEDLIR